MVLIMDEGEILREYRAAKKKTEQVRILAELNCCSKKDMATWLKEHGETVDKRYFREPPVRKPKQKEEREEHMEEMQKTPEPTVIPEAPHRAETEPEPDQKAKADAGKPRLTLVPMRILWDIAAVREFGNTKYKGSDNWKMVEAERFREAAFRHFLKYIDDPGGVDEESGLPHRWHLECNLAFLAELEKHNADRGGFGSTGR